MDARYAEAKKAYSVELAEDLFPDVQAQFDTTPSEQNGWLLAKSALLLAELTRMEYESMEASPRDIRLKGRHIDEVAQIGLDTLKKLPKVSERYRIEADFLGTMIRSRYKGKKYSSRMEDATEKALELGPDNPEAMITAAKRPLFASDSHGGDVPKALAYLDKALAINPDHEQALVFHGIAQEKLGHSEEARADWSRALDINPASKLASEQLKNVKAIDF